MAPLRKPIVQTKLEKRSATTAVVAYRSTSGSMAGMRLVWSTFTTLWVIGMCGRSGSFLDGLEQKTLLGGHKKKKKRYLLLIDLKKDDGCL